MATIKLNNGRVILKTTNGNTRVSCSCCVTIPDFCCPYPAEGLNILYARQDLPQTLIFVSTAFSYTVLLTLTESGEGIYEGVASGGGESIDGKPYRLLANPIVWILQIQTETGTWADAQDWAEQECLLYNYGPLDGPDWPLQQLPNDSFPTDNFSDSYTATCTTGSGSTTKTYYREGLCVWRSRSGGEVNGTLFYRSDATQAQAQELGMGRILWQLSDAGFRTAGDGPYNSPAGSYGTSGQCVVAAE